MSLAMIWRGCGVGGRSGAGRERFRSKPLTEGGLGARSAVEGGKAGAFEGRQRRTEVPWLGACSFKIETGSDAPRDVSIPRPTCEDMNWQMSNDMKPPTLIL